MVVVGTGLKDGSPASVRATNRLRVHIQGNIHAGEVEGKEAAQVLLREFAMGQHADWLKTMVFLITPIFNADGNETLLADQPRSARTARSTAWARVRTRRISTSTATS